MLKWKAIRRRRRRRDFSKYNCICDIFRKALEAQMQNVNFVETGFTDQTDFIVVLYTVTNNALQNNNQFHFKGIIVNVNHI
jgi:ribosomal protein S8E